MAIAVLMMFSVIPDPLATVTYTKLSVVPTGNFYINGELATKTSTHEVTDPALNFKFVADTHGDAITLVDINLLGPDGQVSWVEGKAITLTETVTDTEWTGIGTLPKPGTYTIIGWVHAGSSLQQLMSIGGVWTGDEGTFSGLGLLTFSWLNISFLLVGVAFVGVGVYWEKKS